MQNVDRAQRAETALAGYAGGDPDDLAATIVDLVADLLHLAHQNGIEPDYVLKVAGEHQHAEVEEEAGLGGQEESHGKV